MKKLLSIAVLASVFGNSLFATDFGDFKSDELTGDKKLACEAILCLSSSEKPKECEPSINRYFSIKAKKWKNTVKKRRDFLKLCPVGGEAENDKEFTKLRDDILANVSDPCDLNTLNSKTEIKTIKIPDNAEEDGYAKVLAIRILPTLPSSCALLGSSKYTNIKPKYTCSDKYYTLDEWYKGKTANGEKIKKDCWVFE